MTTAAPAISVIILAHNRPLLVRRALRSVLEQDFDGYELILVDNGSADETKTVCEELAATGGAVRLVRREDSRIGAGRNAALDAARGDFVTFVDDDDYAYPDMLSFLYSLARTHAAGIAFCGSDREAETGGLIHQFSFDRLLVLTPEEAVMELLERRLLNMATPAKLFDRHLFEKERFREDCKYDDIFTTYKLFALARRIAGHGIPKYCFYRHGGNNSLFTDDDKRLAPAQLEEYFAAYSERTAWLAEKLPAIADYVRYSEWSFLLSMYRKMIVNDLSHCRAQRDYCAARLREAGSVYLESPWVKPFEADYWRLYQETESARPGKAEAGKPARSFSLVTPSWVMPGTYLENLRFLDGKREVDGVELLFFLYDDGIRAEFLRELPEIKAFAGRFVFTAHLPDKLEAAHEELVETLSPLVKHFIVHPAAAEDAEEEARLIEAWAARYGSGRFLLENTLPGRLEALLAAVGGDVPVCMDTAHLLLEGRRPLDFARLYGERIAEIHLNGTGADGGDGHRPPRADDEWFLELAPFLRGFTGVLNVELFSWDEVRAALDCLEAYV